MRLVSWIPFGLLTLCITGCDRPEARAESARRVVDSLLPREESLRRFRVGLPSVDSLSGGTSSRDELVRTLIRALQASDTTTVVRLAITRSEFGYLYYPSAPQGLPPYDLAPDLMWFTLTERSNQGVRRALRVYAGKPLQFLSYDCGADASREGENTVYGPCTVRWRDQQGQTSTVRLFSQIIERGGRFKFLSYANRL